MMWFENVKTFFVEQADVILAWLTPANIIAMITAIIMTIRNHRATKKNTTVGDGLVSSMVKVDNLQDTVKANTDVVACQVESVKELDYKYSQISGKIADVEQNFADKFDIIDQKIEAMLNVQAMVYGTIQNNDLRVNVQNTIANAKLIADGTRTELKKQISNLKDEMKSLVDAATEKVSAVAESLEDTVDNAKVKKSAKRY